MAFYEYYSMGMPLFFPSKKWMYRTVYHKEGNLGTTAMPDYREQSPYVSDAEKAAYRETLHPFAPVGEFQSLMARKHWLPYSDFASWPAITYFSSVQELIQKLIEADPEALSLKMKQFNERRFVSSVAYWKTVFRGYY